MGTRSLTVITDNHGEEICVMYRQSDGYPEGHGAELAEFLTGITMVNGIPAGHGRVANGCGCLAAQIVGHFKGKAGGIYLHAAGTRDLWEDFTYFVTGVTGEEPTIKVDCGDNNTFSGPASEFARFIEEIKD